MGRRLLKGEPVPINGATEMDRCTTMLAATALGIAPNNVPHTAVAGGVSIPTPIPGLIIDVPFAFVPSTGTACIGIGGGVGTPGVSGGVVYSQQNIVNVLSGWSVSGSVQSGPYGGQGMRNSSGVAIGNSMGSPGSSITGSYSWCF